MNTLYIRLDDGMTEKIEDLMAEKNYSSQKAGIHIINSFFDGYKRDKTGIEKAREAVEAAKAEGLDSNPSNINHSLVEFMEGILEANGG